MTEPEPDLADTNRAAWLSALEAHIRAARSHAKAAAVHEKSGMHPEYREAELDRLAQERAEFDEAVAAHPEWAAEAPDWPDVGVS